MDVPFSPSEHSTLAAALAAYRHAREAALAPKRPSSHEQTSGGDIDNHDDLHDLQEHHDTSSGGNGGGDTHGYESFRYVCDSSEDVDAWERAQVLLRRDDGSSVSSSARQGPEGVGTPPPAPDGPIRLASAAVLLEPSKEMKKNDSHDHEEEEEEEEIPLEEVEFVRRRLDEWTLSFRQEMAESYANFRARLTTVHRSEMQRQALAYEKALREANRELEHLGTLVRRQDRTLQRHDHALNELSARLGKLSRGPCNPIRRYFNIWNSKTRRTRNRIRLGTQLANVLKRTTLQTTFGAWRSVARTSAHEKKEEAWEASTKEQLETVRRECETELRKMHEELANARRRIDEEVQARLGLADNLKRAFMRGVCALNMEGVDVLQQHHPSSAVSPPSLDPDDAVDPRPPPPAPQPYEAGASHDVHTPDPSHPDTKDLPPRGRGWVEVHHTRSGLRTGPHGRYPRSSPKG